MTDRLMLAEVAWRAGDEASAERLMLEARRSLLLGGNSQLLARVELLLARFALAQADEPRALAHLEAAERIANGPTLASVTVRLGLCLSGITERPEVSELRALIEAEPMIEHKAEALVAWAVYKRSLGSMAEARALLDEAESLGVGPGRAQGLGLLARAELAIADGKPHDARWPLKQAIDAFARLGMRREEGRALLRYGQSVATQVGDDEPAVSWIARAQGTLGAAANHRDRAELRESLRVHVRKPRDPALAEALGERVDALEHAGARVRGLTMQAVSEAERVLLSSATINDEHRALLASLMALPSIVNDELIAMDRASAELLDLMREALAERCRIRKLPLAFAHLDELVGSSRFASEAARAACQVLDADRVVFARQMGDGALSELGSYSISEQVVLASIWQEEVQTHLRSSPSLHLGPEGGDALRRELEPRGAVLVVPMRKSQGVLYADRRVRAGQFREVDLHIASLLCEYVVLGLASNERSSILPIGSWAPEPPTAPNHTRSRVGGPASSLPPPNVVPLAEVERKAFLDAYAACNQSVSRAAKALGVSKVTFYAKLRQWGMHPADESVADAGAKSRSPSEG